ncbi:MAG TPA: hypothetical protein VK933_06895 [Longimicrobiales bacterium]|nr:hypothetical protein [Longimicrobiales bacterium]
MKAAAIVVVFMLAGCASSPAPPAADTAQQPFPDIGGQRVMMLPVQQVVPAISPPATADTTRPMLALSSESLRAVEAELAYWLPEQAPRVRWVLPDAIERAVQGSAALDGITVRDLPVRDFQRSRLQSIGDPLYGDLRRVAVVTDARLALLPIGAVWIPETTGAGRVHLAAALIDTMGGRVLWYGVAASSPGERDDPAVAASAARALALQVPR